MAEEKLSRVNEKREQIEKEVGNQLPCLIPMCESILTCCSYVLNVSGAALLQSPNVRNTDATCTLVQSNKSQRAGTNSTQAAVFLSQ